MNRHRPGSQEDARRWPCGDWISLLRLGCVSCTCKRRDGCGDAASPTLRSVRTHIVGSRTRAERHVAALSSARSDGPAATGALWGCAGRSIRRRAMDPSGDIHRTDSPSLPAFHTPPPIRLRLRAIHRDSSPPSSLPATASQLSAPARLRERVAVLRCGPSRRASSPRSIAEAKNRSRSTGTSGAQVLPPTPECRIHWPGVVGPAAACVSTAESQRRLVWRAAEPIETLLRQTLPFSLFGTTTPPANLHHHTTLHASPHSTTPSVIAVNPLNRNQNSPAVTRPPTHSNNPSLQLTERSSPVAHPLYHECESLFSSPFSLRFFFS